MTILAFLNGVAFGAMTVALYVMHKECKSRGNFIVEEYYDMKRKLQEIERKQEYERHSERQDV